MNFRFVRVLCVLSQQEPMSISIAAKIRTFYYFDADAVSFFRFFSKHKQNIVNRNIQIQQQ